MLVRKRVKTPREIIGGRRQEICGVSSRRMAGEEVDYWDGCEVLEGVGVVK